MKYSEIEVLRKSLGLTHDAFSDLLGIKLSTYYSYKSARNPSGSVIKLLKLLESNPEKMFFLLKNIK